MPFGVELEFTEEECSALTFKVCGTEHDNSLIGTSGESSPISTGLGVWFESTTLHSFKIKRKVQMKTVRIVLILALIMIFFGCTKDNPISSAGQTEKPLLSKIVFSPTMADSTTYDFTCDSVKYGRVQEILVYNNGFIERFPTPWATIDHWRASGETGQKIFFYDYTSPYQADSVRCLNYLSAQRWNNGTFNIIDFPYDRQWVIRQN